MQTPTISIVMFVMAAVFGAAGQALYKSGAQRLGFTVEGLLLNYRLHLGVICYVAVMVLFVAAYKRGGSLSVLYPVYASTFIFGALLASFTEGSAIRAVHVAGMGLIVVGMGMMGR